MLLNKQFLKFTAVGGSMLLLDNLLMFFLLLIEFDKMLARSIVLVITLCISFALNCKLTFRKQYTLKRFIAFVLGVGSLNFISYAISIVLMSHPIELSPFFALNIGAALVFMVNFIYQKILFNRVK